MMVAWPADNIALKINLHRPLFVSIDFVGKLACTAGDNSPDIGVNPSEHIRRKLITVDLVEHLVSRIRIHLDRHIVMTRTAIGIGKKIHAFLPAHRIPLSTGDQDR